MHHHSGRAEPNGADPNGAEGRLGVVSGAVCHRRSGMGGDSVRSWILGKSDHMHGALRFDSLVRPCYLTYRSERSQLTLTQRLDASAALDATCLL